MKDLLIAEICKFRPQMPTEIAKLKTLNVECLKKKARAAKVNYYSLDEGPVLCSLVNLIDY